ncbi:MAG TPA: hypothetical protein VGQ58_02810 [Candidatus Limnocylindrales bacterium]|jgi:hypothetical protein|nr:hypothetical protein [Candidatus Limnocylindrales bacterium]
MSPLQLSVLAVVVMASLATLRLVRAHFGRTPLPEVRGRRLIVLAFMLAPVIALGAARSLPLYVAILIGLTMLTWLAAVVVQLVVRGRIRPLLLLALVGHEGDPEDVPFNPPVTARLAESLALVERANAVFPRGHDFPLQIDRSGFRFAWDALDAATGTLESRIADDHRVGLAVASSAAATAVDARSRLDTLRRLAVARGQVWAT